ncbi:phosphoribosyltransferase [Sciscionella sediminilitoris]|uniref:phosphoribosyltransferase n=1 Tax=Sciscionella sediminilitoris TaxID=1445613 RepID=UPI001E329809|nr:phosphoribosyltransferase family protein [Sciscionella sp. SE31]
MFRDRDQAGTKLGEALRTRDWWRPLVLGIARGGVPVGAALARTIGAELDVVVARKVGAPGQPEFGVAAVTAHGPVVESEAFPEVTWRPGEFDRACAQERNTALRREHRYHGADETTDRTGRDVLLVDDGLATGITATAALRAERNRGPRRLVLAVPVASVTAARCLRPETDEVFCLARPTDFSAVGQYYERFDQVADAEVTALLRDTGN